VKKRTEADEWAEMTAGLYGEEYEDRSGELRDVGQGTRNDIAKALRELTHTVSMAGHRVFDVDVLADMIERGILAPMGEHCGKVEEHGGHNWHPRSAPGEPVYTRRCWGTRI
jgi:hypothetical protein